MTGANQHTHDETLWQDELILRDLYVYQEMSSKEVGEKLGCSYQTILNWLDRFNIEKEKSNREKHPPLMETKMGYKYWQHRVGDERLSISVHRLLAVAKFGFDEVSDMEVHHINGKKFDNRMENIELMNKEEHARYHTKKRWENGDMKDFNLS